MDNLVKRAFEAKTKNTLWVGESLTFPFNMDFSTWPPTLMYFHGKLSVGQWTPEWPDSWWLTPFCKPLEGNARQQDW